MTPKIWLIWKEHYEQLLTKTYEEKHETYELLLELYLRHITHHKPRNI